MRFLVERHTPRPTEYTAISLCLDHHTIKSIWRETKSEIQNVSQDEGFYF